MGILRTGINTIGAIGLSLMGGGAAVMGGLRYLLRATFDAANQGYANGQVLDTVAEGVQEGQLTVVEVDGTLAIVGNKCAFTAQATAAWGDLGFYDPNGITVALGRTLLVTSNIDQVIESSIPISFGDAANIAVNDLVFLDVYSGGTTAIQVQVRNGAGALLESVDVFSHSAGIDYELSIVLGGYDVNKVPWRIGQPAANYLYGASFYAQGGTLITWSLLWRTSQVNKATLHAQYQNFRNTGTLDNFRVPDADLSAVLQPLALSTFTAANGTSLDAITPEVGGAWTERTGNFDIQTNRANISATTGVRDVATIPATVANLFARTTIRKTVAVDSGEFGHCLRWTDDNNFWMVHGDLAANQIEIVERNGGVETQRGATAVALTHSTDYDIVAIANGQALTGFLNGGARVAYAAAALNVAVAVHGIVGNEVGQTFDNYAQNPRTSAVFDAQFGAV